MDRLSSSLTFVYKFAFTLAWPLLLGVATILMFANPDPEARAPRWLFATAWLGGSTLLWWACSGLKQVDLDGNDLVVSNFLRVARVPVKQIARVHQNVILSARPVTIIFSQATPFGRSIVFLPPFSFRLIKEDDIVGRLRTMAAPAREGSRA